MSNWSRNGSSYVIKQHFKNYYLAHVFLFFKEIKLWPIKNTYCIFADTGSSLHTDSDGTINPLTVSVSACASSGGLFFPFLSGWMITGLTSPSDYTLHRPTRIIRAWCIINIQSKDVFGRLDHAIMMFSKVTKRSRKKVRHEVRKMYKSKKSRRRSPPRRVHPPPWGAAALGTWTGRLIDRRKEEAGSRDSPGLSVSQYDFDQHVWALLRKKEAGVGARVWGVDLVADGLTALLLFSDWIQTERNDTQQCISWGVSTGSTFVFVFLNQKLYITSPTKQVVL